MKNNQEITGLISDSNGEGAQESFIGRKGGEELFGESSIPPSFYRCPRHGLILAQDVIWGRDNLPYCPECRGELTAASQT